MISFKASHWLIVFLPAFHKKHDLGLNFLYLPAFPCKIRTMHTFSHRRAYKVMIEKLSPRHVHHRQVFLRGSAFVSLVDDVANMTCTRQWLSCDTLKPRFVHTCTKTLQVFTCSRMGKTKAL